MKFVRFRIEGEAAIRAGVVPHVDFDSIQEIQGDIFGEWSYTGQQFAASSVRLEAPFVPRHILGIGKNFVPAGEQVPDAPALPILFFKPLTSVIGPEQPIVLPGPSYAAKFECELAVVIGREGRHIPESEALEYVFGYTIANDLADFSYFHSEGHWTVGKAFDTFCPLGPVLDTGFDVGAVRLTSYLNGRKMQDAGFDRMITSIEKQISYVSSFMTLRPGDVILTGTPAGADHVRENDIITCAIEGLGVLRNPVVKSNPQPLRS